MPQQRHACRVDIDADRVDTRFHDAVERFTQLFRTDVVLIQANADVGWINFDKFAERILQTSLRQKPQVRKM